jgi:hypothetical protein
MIEMNNTVRKITLEDCLYGAVFILALSIRLLNLGETPLSDFEAAWAIQSWKAVAGESIEIGANPGYFILTTLVFYLFEAGNALARFWPAILGSLLVLSPYGFRRTLGRKASMVMAFGLTLDPGMLALSRLAGGPMMAVGFSSLMLVLIFAGNPIWAGIFGGLALISGPSVFFGILILLVTFGVAHFAKVLPKRGDTETLKESVIPNGLTSGQVKNSLIFGSLTILLAGSLFGRYPAGLGAWGVSLASFFQGWTHPTGVPVLQPILALVFYQPLALVFAVVAAVRGWINKDIRSRLLSIWVIAALVFAVIYPRRQVYDVIWAVLPLWSLAALEIVRYLSVPENLAAAFGQAVIVFVLGVLFWLVSLSPLASNLTWLILLIVPLLVVLTTFLVGMGWSWKAARSGSIWGFCLVFGSYILATAFGPLLRNSNDPRELWTPLPGIEQAILLESTLKELGLIQNGREDWIQIVSLDDSASLRWLLRDFSDVTYVTRLDPKVLSTVIITPEDGSDLSQTMAYRGQDFLWTSHPGWAGALPPQWWQWATKRQAPVQFESLVLWARSDLFPEESVDSGSNTITEPVESYDGLPGEESIE